jgi:hypothetical protein
MMTLTGIVELFKREAEIQQYIVTFSISNGHTTVRIYGHYPLVDGKKTTYRQPIYKFESRQ